MRRIGAAGRVPRATPQSAGRRPRAAMGGDVRIAGCPESPRVLLTAADPDAARDGDILDGRARRDPEAIADGQVGSVHVETDPERLAEPAGTRAEKTWPIDAAPGAHEGDSANRLQRPDQDGASVP